MNMSSGMVVVLENGFNSSMSFMHQIKAQGLEGNLKDWWWSSDKGLIKDPSESDEMVVKAQTMYDAMMGKPVYVNGVRVFQSHSQADISKMMKTLTHNLYENEEVVTIPEMAAEEIKELDIKETHATLVGGQNRNLDIFGLGKPQQKINRPEIEGSDLVYDDYDNKGSPSISGFGAIIAVVAIMIIIITYIKW